MQVNWASPRSEIDLEKCFFYHTIDFKDGITIEGHWDLRGGMPTTPDTSI